MGMKRAFSGAMVALALASAAQAAVLVTSFEQTPFDGTVAGITYSYSTTTGVTNGSYSLAATIPPGWGASMGTLYVTGSDLIANPIIKADFTDTPTNSGNWTDFLDVHAAIQGDGRGWANLPDITLPKDSATHTLSWDATSLLTAVPANPGWFQVIFQYSTQETRTIYVDNVQFTAVPEPTSIGLLAVVFGGLVRRNRAR
jgi:hypothetical protein